MEESITPEMIEAGKSVLVSSDSKSLRNAVAKIYVAMATKDRAVVKEQKNKAEIERIIRIDVILYCAAAVGLLIGLILIVIMMTT